MAELPTPIKFTEVTCADGVAGVVTFDNPGALNALTLEMFKSLNSKMREWRGRDDVRLLFFHSTTPKSFSSGGDVKTLALRVIEDAKTEFVEQFFWWEYSTDLLVREYPKPIICWLDGIVMGGGLGIGNGASHRIVTENSQLAMPELNIGFFPDVGAGFFLNQLPEPVALFLAWTGARLNGADALHLKFADMALPSKMKESILDVIANTEWSENSDDNHFQISNILGGTDIVMPQSKIAALQDQIQRDFHVSSLEDALIKYLGTNAADSWVSSSLQSFRKSSPLAAHVTYHHMKRTRGQTADNVLVKDWSLAVNCVRNGDFKEGLRAMLIDKTRDPKWKHRGFGHVPSGEVSALLEPHRDENKFREFLRAQGL